MGSGQIDDAEAVYREVLAQNTARRGAEDASTLDAMFNLALCRAMQGEAAEKVSQWREAADAFGEAADLCTPQHGADDPQVVEWREAAEAAEAAEAKAKAEGL